MPLTNRQLAREHMDDPHASRADLDEALRWLRGLNRRLGGAAAALRHFKRWSRHWSGDETGPIRILDVGTGSGDIPLAIAEWAKRRGHRVHITAVDLHPVTVDLASEYIGQRDDIDILQADATRLTEHFNPGEFDYAHAGLFLHHLNDVQALTVLRIMDRLASRGLIWNDLVRGFVSRVGVRLLTLGPRMPAMVKHDAIVSVQAGFTKREALDLAQRAGWRDVTYRRHLFHRFTLISEKR